MSVELAIAGLGCFVLAFGHAAIGLRWILPHLDGRTLPSTPFGPPTMTLNIVRFTWDVVTVFLVAFGVLFLILAWAPGADPKTLVLRWFAALWLVAAARACWDARRRLRSVLRFPVPLVFVVIAVLCWADSV
jgi:hypothetical protein